MDLRRQMRRDRCGIEAEIGKTRDLALAHRYATEDLRQVFAEPDADDQFFDLAEPAFMLQPPRVSGKLPHRLDVGSEPSEPVRGALLAIEHAGDQPALYRHALAHPDGGIGLHRLDGRDCRLRQDDEVGPGSDRLWG
jgi:hypothetical protein